MSEFADRSYSDQKLPYDPDHCFYCRARVSPYDRNVQEIEMPSVDHVKPQTEGGIRSNKNKVIACVKCNQLKGSMNPSEFMAFMKGYERAVRMTFNREMAYIKTVKKNLNSLFAIKRKAKSSKR
jgi:hypothetical protein